MLQLSLTKLTVNTRSRSTANAIVLVTHSGDLLIETHGQSVRGYFSTLKGAAVSCDIKVPDNVTVGGYFALDLTLDGNYNTMWPQ